jgi:tripartite-type tricarboxylate transporter receptor subunit TctC
MRRFTIALIALAAASHCGSASPQTYPAKAIRVLIPASPGDSCDVLSRLVAPKVSERLGQQLVVDNRPGAGGQLGLQLLTQAPPDGYTIACGQGGNMVIVPLAYQRVAYDTLKDFAPIALVASNFLGLVVHPSVPFNNA